MQKIFNNAVIVGIGLMLLTACTNTADNKTADTNSESKIITAMHLHQWNKELEMGIVNDFFPPPVAGRIYTYPNIAAYEVLAQNQEAYSSLAPRYEALTIPEIKNDNVNAEAASIFAFYYTGIELIYSIETMTEAKDKFKMELAENLDQETIEATENYGKSVAESILAWAKTDGYNKMRSYPKYELLKTEGSWLPTPPDYTDALEPHWMKLIPLTLDSASQFRPERPTAYDMDTSSLFYKETMEVYQAVIDSNAERVAIAKFWDCNPLVTKHKGHVIFSEKKLTPGGHWVNIGRIAMKAKEYDLIKTAHTYVMLTISIHEAFISCWDEKYFSNYIRPVTVIQEHIDSDWLPILYTPNFPEYPSGHSVVSGSAATILTHIFGENFAFTDSTEVPYGMSPRSFNSFFEASDEAAISRMYGGIHFTPAIEVGKSQGRKVGSHVLETLKLN